MSNSGLGSVRHLIPHLEGLISPLRLVSSHLEGLVLEGPVRRLRLVSSYLKGRVVEGLASPLRLVSSLLERLVSRLRRRDLGWRNRFRCKRGSAFVK